MCHSFCGDTLLELQGMRFSLWKSFLWSGILLHRHAISFSTAPFLYHFGESTRLSCCKVLGSSRNWRMDNKQVCHICHKHRPYWSWTLGPYCKKSLLCSKSPMCTLSQNGYGANLAPPKVHSRPLKSHQKNVGLTQWMKAELRPHSLPSMLLQATDTHSSSFSPLHNTKKNAGPTQKIKTELSTFMLPEVTDTHSSSFSPICMQGWVLPALLPAWAIPQSLPARLSQITPW